MYSGSTLTRYSGRLMGTHQKIDRVARSQLRRIAPSIHFPGIRSILHFEGGNGPDAIKRKSPAKDEPWHFFQPYDASDTKLLKLIKQHYKILVRCLADKDDVRAAFEAAWLAHAVVDGLTPAHQYPFEEKMVELLDGKAPHERSSVKEKVLMPGESPLQRIKNNWQLWGAKGLFTTHFTFEWGVGTLMLPMQLKRSVPSSRDMAYFRSLTIEEWYRNIAQEVAKMGLYDQFYRTGWTIPLAHKIRKQLAPVLVNSVTLIWLAAAQDAQKIASTRRP